MEKLIVDAEGKITIPPRILERHGLHPGDELTLVEVAEGLLLCQYGVVRVTSPPTEGFDEDESRRA